MDGTVDDACQLQEVSEPVVQSVTHLTKHAKAYGLCNMASFTDEEWENNAQTTCCGLKISIPCDFWYVSIADVIGALFKTEPPTCPTCLQSWNEIFDSVKADEPGLPVLDNPNP